MHGRSRSSNDVLLHHAQGVAHVQELLQLRAKLAGAQEHAAHQRNLQDTLQHADEKHKVAMQTLENEKVVLRAQNQALNAKVCASMQLVHESQSEIPTQGSGNAVKACSQSPA